MIQIQEFDFDREVVQASRNVPVLVEFTVPWSLPSKALGVALDRSAASRPTGCAGCAST